MRVKNVQIFLCQQMTEKIFLFKRIFLFFILHENTFL